MEKQLENNFTQVLEKNKDLVQTLEIIQKQRNGVEKTEVKDILARMKYKEASFTLLELKSGEYQWY